MQSSAWTAIATGIIGVFDRKAIPSLLICAVAFLCMGFTLVLGNRSSHQMVDAAPPAGASTASASIVSVESRIGSTDVALPATDSDAPAVIAALANTRGANHVPATTSSPKIEEPSERNVAPEGSTGFPRLVEFTSFMRNPKSRLLLVPVSKTTGTSQLLPRTFQGVGFPHIEMSHGGVEGRYKPYTRLMIPAPEQGAGGSGLLIANVACPGGSVNALAKRTERYEAMMLELAMEQTISASLVKAIITVESCFDARARSPSGAKGLMQLMPDTATLMGVEDVYNPEQNIRGGIKYLKFLRGQFNSIELTLAAYNAGPGNVRRYKGIPPFPETQDYVRRVMHNYLSFAATNHHRASTSMTLVSSEQ